MKKYAFWLLGIWLCSACNSAVVYEEHYSFKDPFNWDKDSSLSFVFENTDSTQARDFYLNLRHNIAYPYHNLYLFFKTTNPQGQSISDTLLFYVQNPQTGVYYGSGYTGIIDHHILFRTQKLEALGTYSFEMRQGMRDSLLSGILDVGLSIEKSLEK